MARGRYEKRLKSPLGHEHKNALNVWTLSLLIIRYQKQLKLFSSFFLQFIFLSFCKKLDDLNKIYFCRKFQLIYVDFQGTHLFIAKSKIDKHTFLTFFHFPLVEYPLIDGQFVEWLLQLLLLRCDADRILQVSHSLTAASAKEQLPDICHP